MGFLLDTQATRSNLLSVDTTLAANITATQNYIPVASTTNFSTSVVAEIETTNEVVSFDSITTNRLLYSQTFDNAYWKLTVVTLTANAGLAPDGTNTAYKVTPTTATRNDQRLYKQYFQSTNATLSIFAKAAGYDYINITLQSGADTTQGVQFNLATGVVVTSQNATGTITDAGNGWYRCALTPTTSTESIFAMFHPSNGSTPDQDYFRPTAWAGDGTSGVLMWGAQGEAQGGATATALTGYLPTTTASLSGLTTVTRGVNGTTAASASSGDSIQQLPYALLNVDMPVRLQGLSVSSDGTGAGRLTLCDNNGDTLCDVDIPDTKIFDLTFDGGILFPNGIFISNSDNITAYTLYTDKYSGDSL